MLRCWSCDTPFVARRVWKESIIRGRSAHQGGPYRIYRCPLCLKLSRIESTPRGRLFASPDREVGILDYLFGWIEVLEPNDFLRITQWHQLYADRRRAFFLHDGDSRYTRGRWFDRLQAWLHRVLGRRHQLPPIDDKAAEPSESPEPEPPPPPTPATLPHPYRILGVRQDASEEEIRAAFRRLARQWHPDKQTDRAPAQLEEASRRLAELVAAFEELNPPR